LHCAVVTCDMRKEDAIQRRAILKGRSAFICLVCQGFRTGSYDITHKGEPDYCVKAAPEPHRFCTFVFFAIPDSGMAYPPAEAACKTLWVNPALDPLCGAEQVVGRSFFPRHVKGSGIIHENSHTASEDYAREAFPLVDERMPFVVRRYIRAFPDRSSQSPFPVPTPGWITARILYLEP